MYDTESTSILAAYELLKLDCKAQGFARSTIDFYHYRLPPFFTWLESQGITKLSQLSSIAIRSYLASLQDRNLADNTRHGIARAIRRFCNFCVDEELIDKSAFTKVKMPKVGKRVLRSFDKEEIGKLLAACTNRRDKAIILFLLDSGVRASELVRINDSDINIGTGRVFVRKGKMSKDRFVFLGGKSSKAYVKYRMAVAGVEAAFPSKKSGERLTTSGLRLLLRRLAKRAGVKGVSPHAFRRTFALWSLRAGMNIYALQKLMGHEDLTTLLRYLGLTLEDIGSAHQKHGPVDHNL